MRSKIIYGLFIVMTIVMIQCKKDPPPVIDFKYDYFPVDIGSWVSYEVEAIRINDFTSTVDSTYTQLKEIVESSFLDNEGRLTYRIERYDRPSDTLPWTIKNVWFATLTPGRAERVEENLRFIKLVFPPGKGIDWKGNQYINASDTFVFMDNWDYEYEYVDQPDVINGMLFDSTLQVIQQDDENLIEYNYFEEKYAKNVGMIYKKSIHLESDDIKCPTCTWDRGFEITAKLLDYSNK